MAYNILFLSSCNSARSIMAEALLNHMGDQRFRAYSAGDCPSGFVHPLVAEFLAARKVPLAGARSKSWREFAMSQNPSMDLVITLCDRMPSDVAGLFAGEPVTGRWILRDLSACRDPEVAREVIRDGFDLLVERIKRLASIDIAALDRASLQSQMDFLGVSKLPAEPVRAPFPSTLVLPRPQRAEPGAVTRPDMPVNVGSVSPLRKGASAN